MASEFIQSIRKKLLREDTYSSFNFSSYPYEVFGWGGNDIVFENLIKVNRPSLIAEVGTYKGQSAINMANALKKYNIDGHIFCIDTWLGSVEFYTYPSPDRQFNTVNGYPSFYYNFLANVCHSKLENYITPIPLPSTLAADVLSFHNVKFDMIYIDGDHTYKSVMSDLESYYPLLNENGVFFGHDIDWTGVRDAVNDFCRRYNNTYNSTQSNFWIMRQKNPALKIF